MQHFLHCPCAWKVTQTLQCLLQGVLYCAGDVVQPVAGVLTPEYCEADLQEGGAHELQSAHFHQRYCCLTISSCP